MKRWVLWMLILVLGGGGGTLLVRYHFNYYMTNPVSPDPEHRKVTIPKGTDMSMVIEILSQEEVVRLPLYFKLAAVSSGKGKRFRPGVYWFDLQRTPSEILDELTQGPTVPWLRLVVPEGSNIWDIAGIIEEAGLGSADKFLRMTEDCAWLRSLGVEIPDAPERLTCAEGFLFPETYFVEPGMTLEEVLEIMVDQTLKELRALKKTHIERYAKIVHEFHFDDWQLLTLASLVEAEVKLAYEKKLVASVFYNRLRKGMPLQTDPTLTYSLERKGAVPTKKDRLNKANRYNTYEYEGLPPGPIGNPGREAIEAVLAPPTSRHLYFVAKRDGSGGHHFSNTYADHVQAVKKYLGGK
ncbi:MAG: endolytic transglycosylase MltG [Pseudomonadota bacterium]